MVVTFASGCFYNLDRDDDLLPGSISGRAVTASDVVPFAKVSLIGSGIVFTADDQGAFRTNALREGVWTLQITSDSDRDGIPERGAVLQATVSKQLHAGESEPRLVSVDVGDVALLDLGQILGTVNLDGLPLDGARVVVERLIGSSLTGTGEASVGTEALTTSQNGGAFQFESVIAGRVSVIATATIDGANFVSAPATITVGGDVPEVFLELVPAEGTRAVVIDTSPTSVGDDVTVTVRGTESLDVVFRRLEIEAPVGGAWAIDVVNSTLALQGVLPGQVVPPGTTTLRWGPVGLTQLSERCADIGSLLDCDHDAFPGLPFLERDADGILVGDGLSSWQSCVEACVTNLEDRCTFEGIEYDCDDDGDGQPDISEPPECYGRDLGTDLDGDGLCDFTDPHPGCDDRLEELTCLPPGGNPGAWFEYLEDEPTVDGGLPDGGVDGGLPDGGVDGGLPDGGLPDGGVDGGAPDGGPPDGGFLDGGAPDGGVDGGLPDGGVLDGGNLDGGAPDGGVVDGGPVVPPVAAPPATGFRILLPPAPQTGPRILREQQLIPVARECVGQICVTGGLVP